MSDLLPQVFSYKYKIGNVFTDNDGYMIEINGYNTLSNCYKGVLTIYKNKSSQTIPTDIIREDRLDKMTKYDTIKEWLNMTIESKIIRYKIHYFETLPSGLVEKGKKGDSITMQLSGIKSLAKLLNNMRKRNPNRRITVVTIVDADGKFLDHVRFLPREVSTQKFITGRKQRLLAHAKYQLGYEIVIGF